MDNVANRSHVDNTGIDFSICWHCEKNQATRISSIPMGPKWGFSPVELCADCDEEIG